MMTYGILNLSNNKLIKINRDSLLFDTNKQEFNAYKNTLRRLIYQVKNNYYYKQIDRNRRNGKKQLPRHSMGKHQNPLPML